MQKYFIIALVLFLACRREDLPEPDFLSIEMANIPEGSFQIGSDMGYVENETPRVVINLSSFQMSKYEITQHQYFTVMNDSPSFNNCDDCPIEQVNWYDAVKFCNELSNKVDLKPAYMILLDTVIWDKTANGYRLPTEAEWEYACKAGTDTDLFTGNLLFPYLDMLDSNLDNAGWFSANSNNRTQTVGKKQANAFGLYDMHGNVWEWCWDYYNHSRYIFMEDTSNDPVDENYNTNRVIRGGSYFNDVFNARSSLRYFAQPNSSNRAIGFRVVLNN